MAKFIFFGGVRNLVGISLLTYLVHIGIALTPALLMVVSVDFIFYSLQVRYILGKIDLLSIFKTYAVIYILNRAMLWLLYEQMGLPIFIAQFMSILILVVGSYTYLKSKIIGKAEQ